MLAIARSKMIKSDIQKAKALINTALSEDSEFPVEFDYLWDWCGYTRKDYAVNILNSFLIKDFDYTEKKIKSGVRGRPKTERHLTLDAAKQFAMLCKTTKGRQVRISFIEAEKELRRQNDNSKLTETNNNSVLVSKIEILLQSVLENRSAIAAQSDRINDLQKSLQPVEASEQDKQSEKIVSLNILPMFNELQKMIGLNQDRIYSLHKTFSHLDNQIHYNQKATTKTKNRTNSKFKMPENQKESTQQSKAINESDYYRVGAYGKEFYPEEQLVKDDFFFLGSECKIISQTRGLEVLEKPHPKYGLSRSYHKDVLKLAYEKWHTQMRQGGEYLPEEDESIDF